MKIALVRGRNPNVREFDNYCSVIGSGHNVTLFSHIDSEKVYLKELPRGLILVNLKSQEYFYRLFPKKIVPYINFLIEQKIGINCCYPGIGKLLKEYDIINTSDTYFYNSYQAAKVKEMYNKKLVVTVWENIPFRYLRSMLGRKIVEYVKSQVDRYFSVTQCARRALLIEGISPDKIVVLTPGIDQDKVKVSRDIDTIKGKLGVKPGEVVILFVGRLQWSKGIYDLTYAVKRLLTKGIKNIKLFVLGSGHEEGKVKSFIEKFNLGENIIMSGFKEQEHVRDYLTVTDIFAFPSISKPYWQEQLGFALLEAFACGKSIIATDSGAIPEIVGEAALIVPQNNFVELSKALKRLILDRKHREKLSRLALERAKIYDAQKVGQEYLHSFLEVSEGR